MIENIKKRIAKYRSLITYIIAGGLTTFVNWGVYALFVHFVQTSITASNVIAWIISVIFAYVINKLWVFESKSMKLKTVAKEFISFTAARIITGVMEIIGVPFLVKLGLDQTIFHIEGALSKITVSVIVVILNYFFSKLVVFKNEKSNK